MDNLLYIIEMTCFENDDPDGDNPDGTPPTKPEPKTFTQAQVEEMITKRQRTLKEEYRKLEQNYQGLLEQTNLSDRQREELEEQLEAIQSQLRTEKEQIEYESKKAEKQYQKQLEETNAKANKYQQLFESSTIERSISDAARAEDGYDAEQFIALLGPRTKMTEEVNSDGVKTGRLIPMVDWTISKEDGSSEAVKLDPKKVVKLMKENPAKYGNMFASNVARGIGGGTAAGQELPPGRIDPRKITTEEYMRLRKTEEGTRALGLTK